MSVKLQRLIHRSFGPDNAQRMLTLPQQPLGDVTAAMSIFYAVNQKQQKWRAMNTKSLLSKAGAKCLWLSLAQLKMCVTADSSVPQLFLRINKMQQDSADNGRFGYKEGEFPLLIMQI